MEQLNRELDELLAEYKGVCEAPEPGANFLPRMWERIDARRSVTLQFRRIMQAFVGAAAVICLMMGALVAVRPAANVPEHATYIDALAEAHRGESLAALGIQRTEPAR